MSVAFDTLHHSVFDHLIVIGVKDQALELFQSYLSDGRMAVKLKERVFEIHAIQRVPSSAHRNNKEIQCI